MHHIHSFTGNMVKQNIYDVGRQAARWLADNNVDINVVDGYDSPTQKGYELTYDML